MHALHGLTPNGVMRMSLLMLVVACVSTSAEQQPATERTGLSGYALTADGMPVSAGTVAFGAGVQRVTTSIDSTGRFHLVPGTASLGELQIIVPGHTLYRARVAVPSSRAIEVPAIRLPQPTHLRVRPVSAGGEPIVASTLVHQSVDLDGIRVRESLESPVETTTDGDGAVMVGPLSKGITTLGFDAPPLARTRVPDVEVSGAEALLDLGTVIVDPGAVLHVDVVDAAHAPLPRHDVLLEDARPLSPFVNRPRLTDEKGRVTFDRLAAGRYRIRTFSAGRCNTVPKLVIGRLVTMPGSGIFGTRVVAGGTAMLRLVTPLGAVPGVAASLSPDTATPQPPQWLRADHPMAMMAMKVAAGPFLTEMSCRGVTDGNGRVVFDQFPPGLARVQLQLPNSRYSQRVTIPEIPRELHVQIPDGLVNVVVTDAVTKKPIAGATVTWRTGGAENDARTVANGIALLEAVGPAGGTLTVTAPGFERSESKRSEPPGTLHNVALTPEPSSRLQVRVTTSSGEPIPRAVVKLSPQDSFEVEQLATTDVKGMVTFSDVSNGALQVAANAKGFATATLPVPATRRDEVVMSLSRGYRVLLDVEGPRDETAHLVRVRAENGAFIEDMLDLASDRTVPAPGRVSLGPLAFGRYVIELHGRERREQTFSIVDRDVSVTVR